jgi:hydrogenase/urease accessory protein HupE
MSRLRCLSVVIGYLLALCSQAAQADTLRPGYLELIQRDAGHWRVTWKAPLAGGLASRAHPAFPDICRYSITSTRRQDASLISTGDLACDSPLTGTSVGLAGIEASFTDALLRIAPLGGPVQVERLTPDRAMAAVASEPSRGQVARAYLALGVEHILAGYDHLLFVLALVLLLMRVGAVIKAVTAFTVAHSITLVGTTLGLFGLAQAPVEALIALSILFLAVEIVKQASGESRLSERAGWSVAFLFGLLHGFGFAGALRGIGLPEGEVPTALLTFNLGVEAGQLVIVAAALAAIALLKRSKPGLLRAAVVASSYLIGTTAAFWFIERLIV